MNYNSRRKKKKIRVEISKIKTKKEIEKIKETNSCGFFLFMIKCSSFYKPRDSFPFDQQFNILMRFIVDQTQTPNLKVSNFVIIVQPLDFKFA